MGCGNWETYPELERTQRSCIFHCIYPNDEYLASGSLDRSMHILSLKEGKIVKTYTGNGGVFEVCWNKLGR